MAYTALYRSYRPKNFSEVAGQEHITRTFLNALKRDKIAHAYLFAGPRGTGKTTIAKILAKAVNCQTNDGHGEPFYSCAICDGINDGSISDVIEIDGASNNGVDGIREIRDKVKYLPSAGKYKVYIIDEVHMLSIGAFNALLKTLEEPPKHVIFILATTEPYKIPATIISRCQRFDFRSISISDIEMKLNYVIEQEGINIEPEAVKVIAESAEGGMRDALSLLDQVISFADEKVTTNDVHLVNGSVSSEALMSLVSSTVDKNCTKSLTVLESLMQEGKEIDRIVSDLIHFYRDLLIYKNTRKTVENKSLFDNKEFQSLAEKFTNQRISLMLNILDETENSIKWTNQKKAFLELALIKMTDDEELLPASLSLRMDLLEKEMQGMEVQSPKVHEEKEKQFTYSSNESSSNNESRGEIGIIESALYNSDKEKRSQLAKGWEVLKSIDDPKKSNIARTLSRSELRIVSDQAMIITYPDKASCNLMMKSASKAIVFEILNRKKQWISDYVALTENEWQEIVDEYKDQMDKGIKNPKLDKIKIVFNTSEIAIESEKKETTSDLASQFFGNDKIKIMEE